MKRGQNGTTIPLTSGLDAFGEALIGSYFPGGTASAPEEDPSMNSIGGGRRLLKASLSLAGRYCRVDSSAVEKMDCVGRSGEASILK